MFRQPQLTKVLTRIETLSRLILTKNLDENG